MCWRLRFRTFLLLGLLVPLVFTGRSLPTASNCNSNNVSPEIQLLNLQSVESQSPQLTSVPFSWSNSESGLSELYMNFNEKETQVYWTNLTFLKCNVQAQFLCTAKYPVEWVETFNKNINELTDVQERHHKDMWTDRIINETSVKLKHSNDNFQKYYLSSISNSSSIRYAAFLGLNYLSTSPFCYAANFSCRSVAEPSCLQANIESHVDPVNQIISLVHSNTPINIDKENDFEEDKDESCKVTITVSVLYGSPGWKCTVEGGKTPGEIIPSFTRACDGAMHCLNQFQYYRKKTCVKRLSPKEDCYGCRYVNKSIVFNPGHIWCKDMQSGEVVGAALYFYSVPQTVDPKRIPDLYLNWNEVDPQKMLFLEPLTRKYFYSGENLTVFCQVSRFFFSFGHTFGFEYENGTIFYTSHEDGHHDRTFNVNRMNKTITVTSTLTRIFCFAPVWNSTEWVNQSMTIAVKTDGFPPKVFVYQRNMQINTENEDENEIDLLFALHKRNATLSCLAEGNPLPNITWTRVSNNGLELSTGIGRADLVFSYVTYSIRGTYICETSNYLGKSSKTVKVRVRDEFALIVQLVGAVIFFVLSAFVVILIFCWKKIREQRRQLRALTDAEIKEFREGNLEVLDNSEYLDTQELLHALPYNDEYEIPRERLHIDMSSVLGTGNFGQVVKGVVYDGLGRRRKRTEVAVKTVKSNHNIAFFKSLLSEVKIMAYLGTHANVVSLVGACTGNIKKREIFIAVEYCQKGSLEKMLKCCRSSFINLVSNDTIYIADLFSENGKPSYANLQGQHGHNHLLEISKPATRDHSNGQLLQFETLPNNNEMSNFDINSEQNHFYLTTAHLLKWSREIANGMEFLGSRKIIHGDLATRNVLLTQSLVAKIGDFGLSRQLMDYTNYVRSVEDDIVLPWKWMSYETLDDMKFSVKSDVWSFGVTLWEIFTLGNSPYPGQTYTYRFLEELKQGMRLHKPTYANSQIYNVMLECWLLDTSQRPSFTDLKDFFEGLLLQTCSDEYLETKSLRNKKKYLNGSSSSIRVYNPGYSILGRMPEEPVTPTEGFATVLNGRDCNWRKCGSDVNEDNQGYLQPLMFEMEEHT